MPFRLSSPDPHERQAAMLDLVTLAIRQAGREVYVGRCDCPPSAAHDALLIHSREKIQCAFCGKVAVRSARSSHLREGDSADVSLSRMPIHGSRFGLVHF